MPGFIAFDDVLPTDGLAVTIVKPRESGKLRESGGREYFRYAGLGFEFSIAVGLFLYLGYLADERWGSDPWGMVVGGGVGLASGIYLLVKESNQMMRQFDAKPTADHREEDESRRSD